MRQVHWTYADVTCATYPLKDIDSIAEDGSFDTHSCLNIILNTVNQNRHKNNELKIDCFLNCFICAIYI